MAAKKNNLIFVVEDNQIYNKFITEYLIKQNFTNVKPYFTGEDCVKAINQGERPDVIIQDYFLEKMNGIDVLLQVKKKSPESEFIFLTSNENMEVAVNTIKFGAYDYIIKDRITPDKVLDRIQKILKLKVLEKRNKQIQTGILLFSIGIILIVLFAVLYFVADIFNVH